MTECGCSLQRLAIGDWKAAQRCRKKRTMRGTTAIIGDHIFIQDALLRRTYDQEMQAKWPQGGPKDSGLPTYNQERNEQLPKSLQRIASFQQTNRK